MNLADVLIEALLVLGRFLAPLMVLVSVPLSVSIVQELLALRGSANEEIGKRVCHVVYGLGFLVVPYLVGMLGPVLLTLTGERTRSVHPSMVMTVFYFALVLLGSVPIVLSELKQVLSDARKNAIIPPSMVVGIWFGTVWAFLYLVLTLQLVAYAVIPWR